MLLLYRSGRAVGSLRDTAVYHKGIAQPAVLSDSVGPTKALSWLYIEYSNYSITPYPYHVVGWSVEQVLYSKAHQRILLVNLGVAYRPRSIERKYLSLHCWHYVLQWRGKLHLSRHSLFKRESSVYARGHAPTLVMHWGVHASCY